MFTVTVSQRGQVAIPKRILDALGIHEGNKLTVDIGNHGVKG